MGDHICSDKGIELMYLDSQITENIIQAFIREDRPILTVHDSYVVQVQDTDYLHQQMRIATKKVLGTELQFDQDYLSYKQAKQRMDGIEEDAILPTTNTPKELIDLIPTPQRTRRYINTIRKFVNWQSEYNPTKTYYLNHIEDLWNAIRGGSGLYYLRTPIVITSTSWNMTIDLHDYITNRMKMSHIYQPVMLKVLLENNGEASIEKIASALLSYDQSQVEYYGIRTR